MTTAPLSDDDLIRAIRERALNPSTRSDAGGSDTALPEPASEELCAASERELGTKLHPFHRRLLTEVANGGFGPAYGLYGLPPEAGNPSMMELREVFQSPEAIGGSTSTPTIPEPVWRGLLAICDWGCGSWSFIDSTSLEGWILLWNEAGMFETRHNIRSLFTAWVSGIRLWDSLYKDGGTRTALNPFTGKPVELRVNGGVDGRPYDWRLLRR